MIDVAFHPPTSASVWERSMIEYLSDHSARERVLLEEYAQLTESTESAALAYMLRLLSEDEQRLHRWCTDLASSLYTEADLSGEHPAIPRLDLDRVDAAQLDALLNRLLEHEQRDAKDLKHLHHELRDVQHTTLWGLLVELMQRDTDKHIAILRFAQRHAKPRH